MEKRRQFDNREGSSVVTSINLAAFKGRIEVTDIGLASGGDASTLILYDGVDATGKKKIKVSSLADHSHFTSFSTPLQFKIGLFIAVTGTSPTATICYNIGTPENARR